jgi:hypothetical protein
MPAASRRLALALAPALALAAASASAPRGLALALAAASAPPPPPPPPSPSCALNGLPCAPPRWAPTWNLTQSTVIQPGHTAGFFSPNHTWGLVSLDWSVARGTWFTGNASNSTCEATLRSNCAALKAAGKAARCLA